jgi:hypothetical protein
MKRFKACLSVAILAAGMTMLYLKPTTATATGPLMAAVVGYWFVGQKDEPTQSKRAVPSGS